MFSKPVTAEELRPMLTERYFKEHTEGIGKAGHA